MISSELKAAILQFRRDRDWEQFHSPRNLATAISIEASELLEPFRWANDTEAGEIAKGQKAELAQEVADLVILLTYFADGLAIDLEKAVTEKLAVNAHKYPVEEFRGSSRKYSHRLE